MFNKFRTAALSAMIGLGAIAAMPAAAQADGLYLNYSGRTGRRRRLCRRTGQHRLSPQPAWPL